MVLVLEYRYLLTYRTAVLASGYLRGYSLSNPGSNHLAKISAAYCARMRTALIKRFEAAERSDRRLRGAAAYFSCNTEDLHVK